MSSPAEFLSYVPEPKVNRPAIFADVKADSKSAFESPCKPMFPNFLFHVSYHNCCQTLVKHEHNSPDRRIPSPLQKKQGFGSIFSTGLASPLAILA